MWPCWLLIYALQWFALAIVSVHAFRAIAYTAYIPQTFCPIFSSDFNIMAAIFSTNRPPCRKKSILARVCFDVKRG